MQIAKCKLQIGLKSVFLVLLWIAGLFVASGCAKVHSGPPQNSEAVWQEERWDGALGAGARFLIGHQDADGAWRSDTYRVFKDGPSVTPLVLETLLSLPSPEQKKTAGRKRAEYQAGLTLADGNIGVRAR